MRKFFRRVSYLFIISCACACERIDLSDEGVGEEIGGENVRPHTVPLSTGMGTQTSPFTVDEFLALKDYHPSVWVVGYAVATTYSTWGNMLFNVPTTYKTNIILSCDSLAAGQDAALLLPVKLSTAALQRSYSLSQNPALFRQCVMFLGSTGRYFSHPGLVDITDGYWLPGFSLSQIKSVAPSDWTQHDSIY